MLNRLKPKFWDHHDAAAGPHTRLFDFRRKWKLIVLLTTLVTLTPLVIMTFVDYRLTLKAMESEMALRTSRLVSTTWRTISFFLTERKSAMAFVLADNTYEALTDSGRLAAILENLKSGLGGFVDLGVVDDAGRLTAYAGPHLKTGMNLCEEPCFQQVVDRGVFISNLEIKGAERSRQIVIAVKHALPDRRFFVLRASLDATLLYELLAQVETGEKDDAFLIDTRGILLTPSRHYGELLKPVNLSVPPPAAGATVTRLRAPDGTPILLGYAHIPETSFILMVIRDRSALVQMWYKPRIELVGFLILGIAVIFLAILGMATFLVHRIHAADQRRVAELHRVEYANKLTSIERLAAGLAHEINNPLAIINQKAGLIRDLFSLKKQYAEDEKLMGLINAIMASVARCGEITKRLLNFARHIEVVPEAIDLYELIQGMVDFIAREADRQGIRIRVAVDASVPPIESDRSHLQQIFLNIVSNCFAAMEGGGELDIAAVCEGENAIRVTIADTGCGIAEADLNRIFEPFFTTKTKGGSTGLGLSITHGLIQRIGGTIRVDSRVGEGTAFTLTLPRQCRWDQPAVNASSRPGAPGERKKP